MPLHGTGQFRSGEGEATAAMTPGHIIAIEGHGDGPAPIKNHMVDHVDTSHAADLVGRFP